MNAFGGAARSWPLTDAGKAAVANFDPKATAQKDCIPVGVPNLMFYAIASGNTGPACRTRTRSAT